MFQTRRRSNGRRMVPEGGTEASQSTTGSEEQERMSAVDEEEEEEDESEVSTQLGRDGGRMKHHLGAKVDFFLFLALLVLQAAKPSSRPSTGKAGGAVVKKDALMARKQSIVDARIGAGMGAWLPRFRQQVESGVKLAR